MFVVVKDPVAKHPTLDHVSETKRIFRSKPIDREAVFRVDREPWQQHEVTFAIGGYLKPKISTGPRLETFEAKRRLSCRARH